MTVQLTRRNLRRVLHMQFPELVCRGKQETFKLMERARLSSTSSNRPFEATSDHLACFVENAREHFFAGVFDPDLIGALENRHGDECQFVLAAADRAIHRRFDLLGYRGLEFGEPIDWHLDPVAGKRAPLRHWSVLDALDRSLVGDSKVVWELNRQQWLVHVAQSWRLTGDRRYAERVIESIEDWLIANPAGMGINWTSSLEVAFRIVAWCWAVLLVSDAGVLTPEIFHRIETAIETHATHVERYLSYYFSPNTHLTGEALGLLYASVVFSERKHASRWQAVALRILVQEIDRHVLPDGIYFERSTCYQRYTADIYLHLIVLARRAGIVLPARVASHVRSSLDALVTLRWPDGSMPNIGDEDGGAVLPLSASAPDDYRPTFSTAAVVFGDPVYAWAARRLAADALWMCGSQAIAIFDRLDQCPPAHGRCKVFPVGGYATMRSSWNDDAHALILDGGPLGCHYSAGHGHADLLSVQCCAFGEPYLVDAGTGCYTGDPTIRDFFRSTAAHSTITVDGQSQAEPGGPFEWRTRCSARLLQAIVAGSLTTVDAYSDAYKRLSDPVSHRRRVLFVQERYWIVIDDLCGSRRHQIDLRFQFAPMRVHIDDNWARATRDNRRGLLVRAFAAIPLRTEVREGRREPLEGWHSPVYGRIEQAPALLYSADMALPCRIVTLLYPAEDVRVVPSFEAAYDADGQPAAISDPDEVVTFDNDEIHVRHRGNH